MKRSFPEAWVFLTVFVFFAAGASPGWAQGMMGGEGMRGMMRNMMGDMLPPMDPAQLPDPDSNGALLMQQFCTQCHNLPGPGLHTAPEWPPVVDRMVIRMRRMSGHAMMMEMSEVPTSDQTDAITSYLQKHALKPFAGGKSPELVSPGGRAFKEVCSQCHSLPDPEKHTSGVWPTVVRRMKGYMVSMGKTVPPEMELKEITGFLQKHGKRDSEKRQGDGR